MKAFVVHSQGVLTSLKAELVQLKSKGSLEKPDSYCEDKCTEASSGCTSALGIPSPKKGLSISRIGSEELLYEDTRLPLPSPQFEIVNTGGFQVRLGYRFPHLVETDIELPEEEQNSRDRERSRDQEKGRNRKRTNSDYSLPSFDNSSYSESEDSEQSAPPSQKFPRIGKISKKTRRPTGSKNISSLNWSK